MNIIYTRFGNHLSAALAEARYHQKRFQRLLADRPTGIRVKTRDKNPAENLKLGHRARQVRASLVTLVLFILVPLLYPEHYPTVTMRTVSTPVIQIQQIPETRQYARAPAAPRPSVPLAVEADEVPEDVTIEPTELDLDSVPIDLRLPGIGVPGTLGPPSDEPLDIMEIEYKPHPIRIVAPEYPEAARKSKLEGAVNLKVLVDKAGNVEKVEVISGPEIFRTAAVAAARQFRFRPGRHEGERRKVWMIMPIHFTLK